MGTDDLKLPQWDGAELTVAQAYDVLSLETGCGLAEVNRRYVLIAGANFPGLVFRQGGAGPAPNRQVRLLMECYRLVRDAELRRSSAQLPAPRSTDQTCVPPADLIEVEVGAAGPPVITPRALNAYARGHAQLAAGEPLRAMGSFAHVCELYPGNPLFGLMHDWSQYLAGRVSPREAELRLEKTLHGLPAAMPELRAECWVMMARMALDRRDYAVARQRYRGALEFAPRHLEAAAGAVARPETPSPSGPGPRPHTESLP